jgi:hypothetical protein
MRHGLLASGSPRAVGFGASEEAAAVELLAAASVGATAPGMARARGLGRIRVGSEWLPRPLASPTTPPLGRHRDSKRHSPAKVLDLGSGPGAFPFAFLFVSFLFLIMNNAVFNIQNGVNSYNYECFQILILGQPFVYI